MRAGFGLLSLLIVAALCMYLTFGTKAHPGYDATVLEKGRVAAREASQLSGRTEDQVPIANTFKLEEVDSGGQFRRVKVVSVDPGTPMATIYGLKPGDEITKVGDLGVADNNDFGLAEANIQEAYQRNEAMTILRDGEQMTLIPANSPISKLGLNGITQSLAPTLPQTITPASQPVPAK
jgi:hypothetical protein